MVDNFGYNAGGWRVDRHPRLLADTTGDGRADIVGFGNVGVYVSRANADGTFGAVTRVVDNFGYNAGGWRVDRHPRFMADTTGDGRADIVGFGNVGVYVSRANADGTFGAVTRVVDNFGYNAGGGVLIGIPDSWRTRRGMVVLTSLGSVTWARTCRGECRWHVRCGDEGGRQLRVQRRWMAHQSAPADACGHQRGRSC